MIEYVRTSALARGLSPQLKRLLRSCYYAVFLPPEVDSAIPVHKPALLQNAAEAEAAVSRPFQSAAEVEAVVSRIYQLALHRAPGAKDLQLWTDEVLSQRMSMATMIEAIAESSEAAMVRDRSQVVPEVANGAFIQFTYECLLGRGAMAAEILHWDHRLDGRGLSRSEMAVALFAQRAAEALTDAAKPLPHDPSVAHVMGTDRFINATEWQEKAAALPAPPPPFEPKLYPSLHLEARGDVLVSAIASLYCGSDFIEQFLENITSQTIFASSELIIIDADSPENEFAVISRYMERFPNIVYHRASSRIGIYAAWNLGVHLSKGRYLTNANLDDLRRVDSFERQAEILEKFAFVDIAYQDFFFSFEGHASFDRSAAAGVRSEVPVISPYNLMQSNSPHNAPMWRRTLHSDVGMFDASYRSAGDYEFWLRCVKAHKTFFKTNDPHVIYFVNPGGLSTKPDTRGIDEANRVTKTYGRALVSPWLTASDHAYAEEVVRRAGTPIDIASQVRVAMDWRYVVAQRALRQVSAESRASATNQY